jgi:hypothetical protein
VSWPAPPPQAAVPAVSKAFVEALESTVFGGPQPPRLDPAPRPTSQSIRAAASAAAAVGAASPAAAGADWPAAADGPAGGSPAESGATGRESPGLSAGAQTPVSRSGEPPGGSGGDAAGTAQVGQAGGGHPMLRTSDSFGGGLGDDSLVRTASGAGDGAEVGHELGLVTQLCSWTVAPSARERRSLLAR